MSAVFPPPTHTPAPAPAPHTHAPTHHHHHQHQDTPGTLKPPEWGAPSLPPARDANEANAARCGLGLVRRFDIAA